MYAHKYKINIEQIIANPPTVSAIYSEKIIGTKTIILKIINIEYTMCIVFLLLTYWSSSKTTIPDTAGIKNKNAAPLK